MNLPPKLPKVIGDSPEAEGLRMAFEAMNMLRDYVASLTPRAGVNVDIHRTQSGTTLVGKPGGTTSDEETEARWA